MPEKIVEKPVSRRRKYTSHTLREALTDRLEEKPLQQITVVELCERADVNRTTFLPELREHGAAAGKSQHLPGTSTGHCMQRR